MNDKEPDYNGIVEVKIRIFMRGELDVCPVLSFLLFRGELKSRDLSREVANMLPKLKALVADIPKEILPEGLREMTLSEVKEYREEERSGDGEGTSVIVSLNDDEEEQAG